MKLLLIEDDVDVASNIAEYFEPRGLRLEFAYDGLQGYRQAIAGDFSLLILDLKLPGADGVEVCRRLRSEAFGPPILMLTARDELEQKVLGFEAGADDYLVKPFALAELYHRVLALTRRSAPDATASSICVGDLTIDLATREVRRGGRALQVNRTEFKILETLARASPRLVTRAEVEEVVWGSDGATPDLLRSYIYRIRRVIDRPFEVPLLHTLRGQGYSLRSLEEPSATSESTI